MTRHAPGSRAFGPSPGSYRSKSIDPMRIPIATYRVQFNADFRFQDATAIVPQLHRLGISHLYASPIFAARSGSTHGYDVVDPNRLNPTLGSPAGFNALVEALHGRGMG